ncbi:MULTISPECIES: RDD family protein [Mycobacteriaceae]|uniref:RDD domain-containing protein n=4 Tax=Mycobacteriaceae TaxID=1762 RepID=F5YSU3_MYCSD|nr:MULTISPECIES: RDD family protein [Mycobacteriaceae]AEF36095.1 RDD domain-containing protein [Mycolicibacter sinensis]BBX14874.1 RDD family protein [Mycobacterium novum]GFG85093.1 RDD family protein [Mycolicibacter algericus]
MASGDFGPNGPGYGQPGPYPPPQGWGQQPTWGHKPGGLGRRFWARLIDGVLVSIVAFALSLFVFADDYPFLVTGLFSGVLTYGYFVLFEVTQGSSPAKRLLGLAVRGPDGASKPTLGQSAVRNAFTLLAVLPYLGPLLAFVAYLVIAVTISGSATKQGKHDELAGGTRVIRT